MSRKMSCDVVLTLNLGVLGEERDVDFNVNYTPGTPDVYYLRNGDPGYPGDPPELEILSARVGNIEIVSLLLDNEKVFEGLFEQLLDACGEAA